MKLATVKHALSGPRAFLENIRIDKSGQDEHESGHFGKWSNKDLDPSPPEQRSWTSWSFFAFQFSIAFSPTTYNVGASLYAIGLNWWTILIASIVVSAMVAALLLLNSRGAAWYHIGYPTFIRASSGIYGSLVFVFIRGVVAILYMAIQTLYASKFIAVMLRCVFGHRWTDIPNYLPESAAITSGDLLAFGILWLLEFPFAFVHPSKMDVVFRVKSVLAPVGLFATMIWALVSSHGADFSGLSTAEAATGSALGWSFMKAINTIVSNMIPPLVNIPDLARYARRPSDTIPMSVGLMLSKPVVVALGMVITAAGYKQFGEAYWNLWDFYSSILDNYWGPGARTLVFFAAAIQAFATFVTNLTSNSIPVGCDLAGLFPRYFTIVRGQVVCFLLAWVCVPWKLTYSATSFLTFLGSYLCFICPIVACMVVDYYLIRHGNIHTPSLYTPTPGTPYYYTAGFNIRAFGSWAAAIALVIPGVSGALNPGSIGIAAVRIYDLGFLISTSVTGVLYYLSCQLWPVMVYPDGKEDVGVGYEAMKETEGFFEDDPIIPEYLTGRLGVDGSVEVIKGAGEDLKGL
ncbi:permease for cytosine/purines, uracil, thiamine, allantoin-domain-containing protein [Aspergillus granulosus]|uniref:Permease for cytosine/purines, uracil, thiamine, allantoin-domain-containing protein n=1 Tax=Aspergillus granulosus TaxID=176169 RepID=A0ABR4H5R4_9EURO